MPTGLAEYLLGRFDSWKKDRENKLDPKWQANLNAMNKVDDERKKPFKKDETKDWRSDDYISIIKTKVFSIFAILVEVLLSKGQIPFSLKPSEYQQDFMDEGALYDQDNQIDKMEDRIRDQQSDRNADREAMKKLLSLLMYGKCISKYNIEPVIDRGFRKVSMGDGEMAFAPQETVRFEEYSETKQVPGHIYTSVWNMFWDMEGGNFQTNDGYTERQMISVQELRRKKGKPFYIDANIDKVISESSKGQTVEGTASLPPGQREIANRKKVVRNLEFWCKAPKPLVADALKNAGQKGASGSFTNVDYNDDEEKADEVEILAEVAGEEIIRLALNQSGKRPHRDCDWEVALDESAGNGPPDNLEDIQHLLNGLVRAFFDNKKLSANVILATVGRHLADPSQAENIKPGMRLDLSPSCDDARKAVQQIVIQDVGQTLTDAIGLCWQWKDTLSLVPEIMQGTVLPKQKPDTAYELSQLLQMGSKYVGLGIRNYDEQIVEPEVTDLYEYNMRDPELEQGKGDYKCHATGFASFQDKLITTQVLKELLGLMLASEALGVYAKIRPHLEQIYKNHDLDADEFLRTEEEIQQKQAEDRQAQAQAMQQAQAQQAQAAQAAQAAKEQEGQAKLQHEALKGKITSDQKEEDFQRDVIKEGMKKLSGGKEATRGNRVQ